MARNDNEEGREALGCVSSPQPLRAAPELKAPGSAGGWLP